jgi:hypothetical protein
MSYDSVTVINAYYQDGFRARLMNKPRDLSSASLDRTGTESVVTAWIEGWDTADSAV